MSQELLGNSIGVTFQQIQKYERGVNRVGSSRLYQFSKALRVPVSYFFEGIHEEQVGATSNDNEYPEASAVVGAASESEGEGFEIEQLSSREASEVLRAYFRIKDPSTRRKLLDLIKSMSLEQA